jgi:hypothetical protein
MSAKLFIASFFLIFGWVIAVGYFQLGGMIHVLLVIGILGLAVSLFYKKSAMK